MTEVTTADPRAASEKEKSIAAIVGEKRIHPRHTVQEWGAWLCGYDSGKPMF